MGKIFKGILIVLHNLQCKEIYKHYWDAQEDVFIEYVIFDANNIRAGEIKIILL